MTALFWKLLLVVPAFAFAADLHALGAVVGDGISLANGQKTESVTDLSLPLRGGQPLEWERSYSNDGALGSLGVGWKASLYDMVLKKVEAKDCGLLATPPSGSADLEVGAGPVADPCPNEPSVGRDVTFCKPGDANYYYVFSDCDWHKVRRQTAGIQLIQQGREEAFYALQGGNYKTPAGRTEELRFVDGGWELTAQDGTVWIFVDTGSIGVLTGRRDRNGNAITIDTVALSGSKRRVDITGPGGRGIKVTISERNLVESVEDPGGGLLRYTYNSVSQLVKVEGPGPGYDDGNGYVATYGYDALGRMVAKDEPKSRGLKRATYAYASTGQVAEVRDGLGRLREKYDWSNAGQVSVTRGRGQTHTLYVDAEGRLVKVRDPFGLVDERGYDDAGNLVERRILPADGTPPRTMRWSYDSYRNVTRSVDAEGGAETWIYASVMPGCGCDRFATSHTDKRGYTTTRSFDSMGNLTATTDAAGKSTFYGYDAHGQRVSSTSPRGGVTTYDHNAQGDLTAVHGPAGDVMYEVDALGRVTAVTDEQGHRTAYRLDGFGNALTTTYADGSFVASQFGAHGELLSQSLQTGQGQTPIGATDYAYDAADQLRTVTDAEGKASSFAYDGDGKRTGVTDANNATFTTDFDVLGRQSGGRDPLGNQTIYILDAFGNRKEVQDANGQRTRYAYDKADRLRSITDANEHVIEFRYDTEGNRRFMVDARGNQTEWRYDARGLLTDEIDAKGVTVKHYDYDDDGNVKALTDGNGLRTEYTYDLAGRLLSEIPASGSSYGYAYGSPGLPDKGYNLYRVTDPRGTETFIYDPLDRLETHTKPTGEVLQHRHDARGNRTRTDLQFRLGSGRGALRQTWAYDKLNRNIEAVDLANGKKTLVYDAASRLVREDLPGHVRSEYLYDGANRLLDLRNLDRAGSLLSRSRYALDGVGNRMSKESIAGKESYSYDKTYQLTGVRTHWADLELEAQTDATLKLASGVTKTVAVTYDPMGNRVSYDETYTGGVPPMSKAYSHNAANEMLNAGGVVQSYDDNGNLSGRGSETLHWDHRNRLIGVNTPGKDPWSAAYDYNNRIDHKAVGGEAIDFIYDDLGRLWAEVDSNSGAPKKVYSHDAIGLIGEAEFLPSGKLKPSYFLYDGLGSVVTVTDKKSNVLQNFSYGAFGEGGRGDRAGYIGRWGPLSDFRVGVLCWNRWNGMGSDVWFSRDPLGIGGGVNQYGYVANNPVSNLDPTGLSKECDDAFVRRLEATLSAIRYAFKKGCAELHRGDSFGIALCKKRFASEFQDIADSKGAAYESARKEMAECEAMHSKGFCPKDEWQDRPFESVESCRNGECLTVRGIGMMSKPSPKNLDGSKVTPKATVRIEYMECACGKK